MKSVIIILLLFVTSDISYGQIKIQNDVYHIEGKVISGVNKKPLADAVVYLKQNSLASVTDSLGYFIIKNVPAGSYQLITNYFGYDKIHTTINITTEPLTGIEITLTTACTFDKSLAEADIVKGKPKLLLVGSIAPVVYMNQHKFERKYKVQYYDFGCTPPADECIEEYNKTIFSYLDKKYGNTWRKEVRQDVVFLNQTY